MFRILISYWYYKHLDLEALMARVFQRPYPPMFADSGAFSAMTQGVSIALGDYAQWLLTYKHLFQVYSNLDVIRHPLLTWNNQERLEGDYGLTPLPVFHVATPWTWLEHYLDRYRYVALGVAGHPYRTYMGWLVRCFQAAQGRAVYHGFGITAWEPWRQFPWFSVDSSSWGQGFRYGQVPVFLPHRGKFGKFGVGKRREVYQYAPAIRELGFDPEDFADRARNRRGLLCALAAMSYMQAEVYLRKRHGPITIPGSPGADEGVTLYLAEASSDMRDTASVAAYLQHTGPQVYLADGAQGMDNVHLARQGVRAWLDGADPGTADLKRGKERRHAPA